MCLTFLHIFVNKLWDNLKKIIIKRTLHLFAKLRDSAENSYAGHASFTLDDQKAQIFQSFKFFDRYQCIYFVCFIKKCFEWFLLTIIAKVEFNIYLFMFIVAIHSSLQDIKQTFAN